MFAKILYLFGAFVLTVGDVAFLKQVPIRPGNYIRILEQNEEITPSGSYKWSFKSENGIEAKEEGIIKQLNSNDAGTAAEGYFRYSSPEGIPVSIRYTADENGFQPEGNVIPTPPPVPVAIARALEFLKSQPARDRF